MASLKKSKSTLVSYTPAGWWAETWREGLFCGNGKIGANIFGGAGSVLGTVFGTILLGMIKNGLVQIHASEYWLDFITGAVILLALLVNLIQLRKKGRC